MPSPAPRPRARRAGHAARSAPWLTLVLLLAALGCAHRSPPRPPVEASGIRPAAPRAEAAPEPAAGGARDDREALEEADAGDEFDEFDELDETPAGGGGEISDPIAPWNRAMFVFNDRFYFWVLKPVAQGYRAIVPKPVRRGVVNFFHNLATPGRLVSDLLQLKGRAAAVEAGTFMINSTWGILGFGNWFEDDPEARTPEEDLGQVLGAYGVGQGFYIVWPLLGPSTLRDSVGYVGDLSLTPTSYLKPFAASLGANSYRVVNATSFQIGDYESLKDAAIDPYLAVRDAYFQHRAKETRE